MKENQNLAIGYVNGPFHDKLALSVQTHLAGVGIESTLIPVTAYGGLGVANLEEALMKGYIDTAVCLLRELPTTQKEGLCIAALGRRELPNDWLLMRKERGSHDGIFGLPDHASIVTEHDHTKAQFLQLNPTFQVQQLDSLQSGLNRLDKGEVDALVFSGAEVIWSGIDLADYSTIKLSTREIVPYPAQGTLAMLTLVSDVSTRKILQKIHQSGVAKASNIERRTLQLFSSGQDKLGVYCEMDYGDNFHAWAVLANPQSNIVQKCNYSSSTSYKMPEQLVNMLKGNFASA